MPLSTTAMRARARSSIDDEQAAVLVERDRDRVDDIGLRSDEFDAQAGLELELRDGVSRRAR